MSYRCLYFVEALTVPGYEIYARRIFRNKRAAERAIRAYSGCGCVCYMRKLSKYEHFYIWPDDVEG